MIGADEFLYSKRRWCLWIEDNQLTEAKEVPEIKTRIDKVYEFRKNFDKIFPNILILVHNFILPSNDRVG